jgi:hypothetical protein
MRRRLDGGAVHDCQTRTFDGVHVTATGIRYPAAGGKGTW